MVNCGTVTVGDSFDPNDVRIDNCEVTEPNAAPGGRTTVVVTVSNGNPAAAHFDLRANVGGETSVSQAIAVSANGTTDVTMRPNVPAEGGEYSVSVTVENVRKFSGD